MVTPAFNPCAGEVEADGEFKASLVHPLRSGTARTTKRDPVSKGWVGLRDDLVIKRTCCSRRKPDFFHDSYVVMHDHM